MYDITKPKAPKMPTLGRGTECIKILLSQASKDVREPLVPMLFPVLGAHMSGAEFQYPDLSWKEPCGQMANLVAESGGNKGQLSHLVEAICRNFRQHDDAELWKLVEWQKMVKTRGANKEKPLRPEVGFWFPPADVTNPSNKTAKSSNKTAKSSNKIGKTFVKIGKTLWSKQVGREVCDFGVLALRYIREKLLR